MTLNTHLTHLQTSGLIQLAQEFPELEYLFRHALVQDAAYESLLFSDRKQLHLSVGQTIEQMYPEQLAEIAPVLGQHFAAAEDDEKALHYFTLAGDTAVASHANQEAISHYQQALTLAHDLQPDSKALCQLYLKCGRAHELISQFEAAITLYKEMEQWADRWQDRPFKMQALIAQAILLITFTPLYDIVHGEKLVQEALTLASELGDQATEVAMGRALTQLYRYTGRMPQAIQLAEHTLILSRQLNLTEQTAFMLYDLGVCYGLDGRFPQAIATLQEAISQWRTLANPIMLADSLATTATLLTSWGEFDQALTYAQEALQISQKAKNIWGQSYAQQTIGLIPWHQGNTAEAITIMLNSIKLSLLAGLSIPQVLTQADLATVYGSLGAVKTGIDIAQKAVTVAFEQLPNLRAFQSYALTHLANLQVQAGELAAAETTLQQARQLRLEDGRYFHLFIHISQSYLALAQSNYQQAITETETALDMAQQFDIRTYTPLILLRQAQAFQAVDQPDVAYERLQKAWAAADALGSKMMLWQIFTALCQLELDEEETAVYQQQAQTIIHFIADHTPSKLRDTFLNLPQVQAILT